ncbi:MAG: hypothetical protein ACE15D_05030 [Candidatus Eisenbacteria bacterium]
MGSQRTSCGSDLAPLAEPPVARNAPTDTACASDPGTFVDARRGPFPAERREGRRATQARGWYCYEAASVQCCDSYGNSGGDGLCGIDLGGNFSADPLFCDAPNGDYTLDWASPCLPGNHPDGVDCGLIGALDAACGTPPVTGACCLADNSCIVIEAENCPGTYMGDGTTCTPEICVPTAVDRTTWGRIRGAYR